MKKIYVLILAAINVMVAYDLAAEESSNPCVRLGQELLKRNAQDFNECLRKAKIDPACKDVDGLERNRKTINILIVLDASGSMRGQMNGQSKMIIAKNVVQNFVAGLPKNFNVGLLVYGHKGSNQESEKTLSCRESEMLYAMSPYHAKAFNSTLDSFDATGWTAIAGALETAKDVLAPLKGENVENIIYLVSDGIETCESDPVSVARYLHNENISTAINIRSGPYWLDRKFDFISVFLLV